MHLIPDSWSHLHILASVFPSVGLVFALGFYVVAMFTNNAGLTRICLAGFALLGLVAIPTYLSGTGSWDVLSGNSKISEDLMDYHYGWGVTALAVLTVTGVVAFIELVRAPGLRERCCTPPVGRIDEETGKFRSWRRGAKMIARCARSPSSPAPTPASLFRGWTKMVPCPKPAGRARLKTRLAGATVRDRTTCLGMEDSNSQLSFLRTPFETSPKFASCGTSGDRRLFASEL
jgi:hypothetical protein